MARRRNGSAAAGTPLQRHAGAAAQELDQGLARHRAGDEIALGFWTTRRAQEIELLESLHALGGDAELEAEPELHDAAHDRDVVGIGVDAADERAVDLDPVDRQPLEQHQAGLPGAEIVQRDPCAHVVQLLQGVRDLVRAGLDYGMLGQLELEAGRLDRELL
jgi:hypothetical protein